MDDPEFISTADLERLSPDERAEIVDTRSSGDLSGLDPAFTSRAEATARRLLEQRGLLDTEPR